MREYLVKKFLGGVVFALAAISTTLLAVAVTGTIKSWTTGEVLSATDLNTTISSLKTAIEGIPNWTKNGTSATYTDGNVGIGTSSPQTTFEIASTGNNFLTLTRTNKAAGTGEFYINVESNSQATLTYDSTNSIVFGTSTDPSSQSSFSEKMRIGPTGNVGIGITNPSHILHINAAGRSTQANWDTTSDERLKDIHGKYTKGLSDLVQISPINFQYKKDNPLKLPDSENKIGVSAQALEKIFPEAVKKQKDGYLTVNSDPVFWAMVNSIKELNTTLNSEKIKNENLSKENQKLQEELKELRLTSVKTEERLKAIETMQMAKK